VGLCSEKRRAERDEVLPPPPRTVLPPFSLPLSSLPPSSLPARDGGDPGSEVMGEGGVKVMEGG